MFDVNKMMEINGDFVRNKEYLAYNTEKIPKKKVAILTCMDARLTELLTDALGIKNGDAKIIKNAGGTVNHPYGSVMRSLLICIYQLGVENILVIGHHDCGMQNLDSKAMLNKMRYKGISTETIDRLEQDIDVEKWLAGFSGVEESVRETTRRILEHPLVPATVKVYSMVMNPNTGEVTMVD